MEVSHHRRACLCDSRVRHGGTHSRHERQFMFWQVVQTTPVWCKSCATAPEQASRAVSPSAPRPRSPPTMAPHLYRNSPGASTNPYNTGANSAYGVTFLFASPKKPSGAMRLTYLLIAALILSLVMATAAFGQPPDEIPNSLIPPLKEKPARTAARRGSPLAPRPARLRAVAARPGSGSR